jgi:hypothetical protein
MAHYALLDKSNTVVNVIVGKDEDDNQDWEQYYSKASGLNALRTSYNTQANGHLTKKKPFRGNYAGIGYTYNSEHDVFVPPQPFSSWILNMSTWQWESRVPKPASSAPCYWDENKKLWVTTK